MTTLSATLEMVDKFSGVMGKIDRSMKMSETGMQGFKKSIEKPINNGPGDQMAKQASKSTSAFSRIGQGISGFSNKIQSVTTLAGRTVSTKMRSMGTAITNGVTKLHTAVSKPFNRGPGKQLEEEAVKADKAYNKMQAGANKTGSMFKAVMGGAVVGGAINKGMGMVTNSVGGAISRIDTLSNSGKVFGNLGISAKASTSGMDQLDKAIDGLPTALDTAVQGVQTFVSTNGDMNKSVKLYKAVNDTILGFGGNTEQSASAVMQLGKAFGTGKIQGDAFNALIENGAAGALPELAKKMGMTQEQMVEMGSKGKLSSDKFGKALIELNEKGGGAMAATSKMAKDATAGISTSIAVAKSAITRSVAHVIQQIGPQISAFFQGVKAKLNEMKPLFQTFGKVIGVSFKVLGEAITYLTPLAKAVAPMAGIFLAASGGAMAYSKSMGALAKTLGVFANHPVLSFLFVAGTALVGLYQNNEDFRKSVDDTVKSIAEFAKGIADWFNKLDGGQKTVLGLTGGLGGLLIALIGMSGGFAIVSRTIGRLGGAIKGLGGKLNVFKKFKKASKSMEEVDKAGNTAKEGTEKIKKSFAGLQKMAGIALIISSVALLAFAMAPLAKAGSDGAVGMLAFGASVALMAGVLGAMGTKLSAGLGGILAFGAAVGIIAFAMAPIAQAGTDGAIAVAVFALSIAVLAGVMGLLGPLLAVAAPGMLAFGAAILMVGLGIGIAAAGIAMFAMQLPIVATFGLQSALAFLALGGALVVFGVGALIAGVGLAILSVGLIVLSVGLILVGVSALMASVGLMMLTVSSMVLAIGLMMVGAGAMMAGAGMLFVGIASMMLFVGMMMVVAPAMILAVTLPLLAAGLLLTGAGTLLAGAGMLVFGAGAVVAAAGTVALLAALTLVNTQMNSIAKNAANSAASLKEMVTAIDIVKAGLDTIGSAAKDAVGGLLSAFSSAIAPAKSNGTQLGTAASMGVTAGLTMGTPMAMAAMTRLVSSIRSVGMSAVGTMRSIGMMIGQGLAVGMNSALGAVTAAANRLVGEAERAARAKAKIHSPSRLMRDQVGRYIGEGMAVGMDKTAGLVSNSADGLVDAAVTGVKDSTLNASAEQHVIASGLSYGSESATPTASNRTQTINIQAGAIQVTGTQAVDPKEMLRVLEEALLEIENKNLSAP